MADYREGRERRSRRWGPYENRSQSRPHGDGGGRGGGGAAYGGASGNPDGGLAEPDGVPGRRDGRGAAFGGALGRGGERGAAYGGASGYRGGGGAAFSGASELPEVYVNVANQGGRGDGGAAYSDASGRPEVHVTVRFGSGQLAQHGNAERPEAYQNGQAQEHGYDASQSYSQSLGQRPSGSSDDRTGSRGFPSTQVDEVDRMSTFIPGGLHPDSSEAGGQQNDIPGQTEHGSTQYPIRFEGSNEQIIALIRSLPEDYLSIVIRREEPPFHPPRRGTKRFPLKRLLGESAASTPAETERSRADGGRGLRRTPKHREKSVQRVVELDDEENVLRDVEDASENVDVNQDADMGAYKASGTRTCAN